MTDKLRGIYVTISALRNALKDRLDREPTEDELQHFINYVEVDIDQWLRDNAKAFMEHLEA